MSRIAIKPRRIEVKDSQMVEGLLCGRLGVLRDEWRGLPFKEGFLA